MSNFKLSSRNLASRRLADQASISPVSVKPLPVKPDKDGKYPTPYELESGKYGNPNTAG